MGRKKPRDNRITERDLSNSFKLIIAPKNEEQKNLLRTISSHDVTFIKGSPGSGKTYLSVAFALQELLKGKYDKIVFSRPVVEAAGERLGFLPGSLHEKIDPYMMPIFDAMAQLLPEDVYKKLVENCHGLNSQYSQIQILPLAYMRGTTFRHSFVICDEMQNANPDQIRMVLTRLGEGSKMVISGDVKQTDIKERNGLEDAFELLSDVEEVGFCVLSSKSIVRHPIIEKIEEKYENRKPIKKQ